MLDRRDRSFQRERGGKKKGEKEGKGRRGEVRWRGGGWGEDPCPSNLDFQLIGSESRAEDEKRNSSYLKSEKFHSPLSASSSSSPM